MTTLEGVALRSAYLNNLSFQILTDDVHPPLEIRNGQVDLTHYGKPVAAPDYVKAAIHDGYLNLQEAADNFMVEVERDPNFHCRAWVEKNAASYGGVISKDLADYERTGRRPNPNDWPQGCNSAVHTSPIWNEIRSLLGSLGIELDSLPSNYSRASTACYGDRLTPGYRRQ